MAENYINGFDCTLTASCSNSDGTISVSAAASVASGFRILVGSELMLVTGGGTTTTWSVTRGIESTAAASHSSGVSIYIVLTKGALDQIKADWFNAAFPSDDLYLKDPTVSGYGWGLMRRVQVPDLSSFSWINQGGASIAASKSIGAYRLNLPPANDGYHAYVRTVPATPYTFTALLTIDHFVSTGLEAIGICLADNSNKLIVFVLDDNTASNTGHYLALSKYNSVSSFNAHYRLVPGRLGMVAWMRITDNGTTRSFLLSVDGVNWSTFYSGATNDFFTPTKIGFVVTNQTTTGFGTTILGMEVA